MKQWYPKEFSKLTKVSVRTLHHYDEIGLLNPSVRLPNGYRLYSEKDLLLLQRIIALKFFGFTLSSIQDLLVKEFDALAHFKAQRQTLQNQITQLGNADKTLGALIHQLEQNKSIQWDNIVQLIEDYSMTKETEMIWGTDSKKQQEYQRYLVDKGLATQQQLDQCNEKVKHWNQAKVESIKNEQDELFKAFTQAVMQNLPANNPSVQQLVSRHFENIKHFWTPEKASYIQLGNFYCQHPDFEKFFVAYHPKLAEYLRDAMTVFAEREL
ncbi:MAG: MerR family transcriptional regulator [Candidatus Berkiella sp.]